MLRGGRVVTHTESELERMVAAARGIPVAPPQAAGAELGQRLVALTVWLRFWHERRHGAVAVTGEAAEPARDIGLPRSSLASD